MRSRATGLLFPAAGALALLAGCGSVTSLIPDQNVGNTFGLQGQTFTAQMDSRGRATVPGFGEQTVTFNDPGSLPGGIKSIRLDNQFSGTVDVSPPEGQTTPDQITLQNVKLQLFLSDAATSEINVGSAQLANPITLTRDSGNSYHAAGSLQLTQLDMSSSLNQIRNILTSGGQNSLRVQLTLEAVSEPGVPAGTSISVTIQSSNVRIGF